MATNRNQFDEVAEEIQVTNENNEVPQQTPATNEDSTVAVTHGASQGDTKKNDGTVAVPKSWFSGKIEQLFSRPVLQGSFMDADENIRDSKVIYRSLIERNSKTPYTFTVHDPAHIITGIACRPKDAETSSPGVDVVRGGVGYKEVEIMLKPLQRGNWCCCVEIRGIEDKSLQDDSTSYKKLTM